ncbi:hypothetical protein AHF37_08642 [Paragonimus kellicotti]|nr:hypothetical protein AHF37_08642 [Paragonimus kellicotti]
MNCSCPRVCWSLLWLALLLVVIWPVAFLAAWVDRSFARGSHFSNGLRAEYQGRQVYVLNERAIELHKNFHFQLLAYANTF